MEIKRQCGRTSNGKRCENEAAENHAWCKKCKAAYQKEFRDLVSKRAFVRGAVAMRDILTGRFGQASIAIFLGAEVARFISRQEIPDYSLPED
jgi:hypothetical protein